MATEQGERQSHPCRFFQKDGQVTDLNDNTATIPTACALGIKELGGKVWDRNDIFQATCHHEPDALQKYKERECSLFQQR